MNGYFQIKNSYIHFFKGELWGELWVSYRVS